MIPTWTGRVITGGLLVLDRPKDYNRYVLSFAGQFVEVVIRKRREKRSNRANAFYWAAVVPEIAKESGMTEDETHTGLKIRFLTVASDGPLQKVRSTTELSVEEFSAYTEQCMAMGAEMFGIVWEP